MRLRERATLRDLSAGSNRIRPLVRVRLAHPFLYLSESLSAALESGLSASDPVAFVNAN